MSSKSAVNNNPESDGYKLAEFILSLYGKGNMKAAYADFSPYPRMIALDKFSVRERLYLQGKFQELGMSAKWEKLKTILDGEEVSLSQSDLFALRAKIDELEKRIEKLEKA